MTATKEQLVQEMRNVFGEDEKRIAHALGVLGHAEKIQAVEGGDGLVVTAAAILHDIGIHEAERKYASSAGKYQEIEGPPIAERILSHYDLSRDMVEHVLRIIANHHSARDIDTTEFRIVWDSDWLVNIPEEHPDISETKLRTVIARVFKTDAGRQMASELFLKQQRMDSRRSA